MRQTQAIAGKRLFMTDQDHLDRINALTRNARQTWFALLAALVFVGITLMGVEHIDFYGVDRATELPLVSVEVPTPYFFYTAPILIAAIYGYFHLYLIRLWDALGAAPSKLNGIRLGDAIAPWLVADAALDYRARYRKDNCTTQRILEIPAGLLNLLLAWGFGVFVLAFLYEQSLPARNFVMSAIALASVAAALFAGFGSLLTMRKRLRNGNASEKVRYVTHWVEYPAFALGVPAAVFGTYLLTEGPTELLAPLNLSGENIVERPAGWLSYRDARAEFRADWCRREFVKDNDCQTLDLRAGNFATEFERRRSAALSDMRRPDWSLRTFNATNMDLRRATLTNSFLAGANLSGAQMEGAVLIEAQMEGAVLIKAQMEGAVLSGAQMEAAVLSGAQMEGAVLIKAQMEGAVLSGAQMEGAVLSGAQMEGANLDGAQMEAAVFDFSELTGTPDAINVLFATNLSMSTNIGGMLRFVDLSRIELDPETDFRNSFLDASVTITPEFRAQMGNPCQWVRDVITDDDAFYGHWRGWIEVHPDPPFSDTWSVIAPEGFENVTAIQPPPGCEWKTGPMPRSE